MFVLESQVYIREKKVSNLFPKVVYYLLISNADFDMGFQNESFLFLGPYQPVVMAYSQFCAQQSLLAVLKE